VSYFGVGQRQISKGMTLSSSLFWYRYFEVNQTSVPIEFFTQALRYTMASVSFCVSIVVHMCDNE
jgi:hypothetical protein